MKFKCFECSELFSEQKEINTHLKKKHFVKENKDPIYCVKNNDCKRYFHTFRALNAHSKTCTDECLSKEVKGREYEHKEFIYVILTN